MSAQATQDAAVSAGLSSDFQVAHHFDSADTQFDAGKMGVWMFLVTEVLLFGGLFAAFFVYRSWYFDAFVEAHHHLDKVLGTVNTVVLLASSLTMALAIRAAQTNKKGQTVLLLALTLLFAAGFLGIKYVEYSHKIHDGLVPFRVAAADGSLKDLFTAEFTHPESRVFFAIYFMMTGIHGIHILIGMGVILWTLILAQKGRFSSRYYAPLEGVGLYWHLVDLVWIFVFPMLYLVG